MVVVRGEDENDERRRPRRSDLVRSEAVMSTMKNEGGMMMTEYDKLGI
jgi:hypothetical protein